MSDMSEFPGNSFRDKENAEKPEGPNPEEKKIEQVTSEPATRRKKPLGKRFANLFFGGDAKTAGNYVIFDVLIPAAKDMIVNAGSQMIERVIFGENRRSRPTYTSPLHQDRPIGRVQYNRYSMQPQQPNISRQGRATHDFDEIVLNSRSEAESVLEQLHNIVSRYEAVSVADLYTTVGLASNHVDNTWGWTNLSSARVMPLRGGGYLLDLPEPKPL